MEETYQWICTVHCIPCMLKLCQLNKAIAFVDPPPYFVSLLEPEVMSVLDGV